MTFHEEEERQVIKKAELSITPMIDVVFLLLIFFMVGMKFKELDRKLETDLPQMGEEQTEQKLIDELWVFVKKGGTEKDPRPVIQIDRRVMPGRTEERVWDETRLMLERLARVAGVKKYAVLLVPDPDAPHGYVMKALDILKDLGYENINFKQ
ncbi:MAG: ExbD/TolR family protein [bacterium]